RAAEAEHDQLERPPAVGVEELAEGPERAVARSGRDGQQAAELRAVVPHQYDPRRSAVPARRGGPELRGRRARCPLANRRTADAADGNLRTGVDDADVRCPDDIGDLDLARAN